MTPENPAADATEPGPSGAHTRLSADVSALQIRVAELELIVRIAKGVSAALGIGVAAIVVFLIYVGQQAAKTTVVQAELSAQAKNLEERFRTIDSDIEQAIARAEGRALERLDAYAHRAVRTLAGGGPPKPIEKSRLYQNDHGRPLIVTAFCNATGASKDLEVRVGERESSLQMVESVSGGGRLSLAAVVPATWFYRFEVVPDLPEMSCEFWAWPI
jgi:hypothetical protein